MTVEKRPPDAPLWVGMTSDGDFRIDISDSDIRHAKVSWLTAWESDVTNVRVSALYEEYAGLVRAQAQQIAEDFRAGEASTLG